MKTKKILYLLFLSIFTLSGCENTKEKSASKSLFAMDTYMNLQIYGENCEEAIDASVTEINRLDDLLSTGIEISEIAALNKNHGGTLSEDVSKLVAESIEIYRETDGAFDITIYPVMKAWGFTNQEFRVPDDEELSSLLKLVDSSELIYDESKNTLEMPEGFEVDLGGIAKGYTGQRIVNILENYEIESALINLGGNIQVVGYKTDGSKWKVGIEDPEKNGNYLGAMYVTDKAVVTSGGYERYFEKDGITYHHIIDPKTGMPAYNGLKSVTIVCEDGTLADALSTSLFVMGTDKAVSFWKVHSDEFECVLYTNDGRLLVTEGLEDCFESNNKYEIINGR